MSEITFVPESFPVNSVVYFYKVRVDHKSQSSSLEVLQVLDIDTKWAVVYNPQSETKETVPLMFLSADNCVIGMDQRDELICSDKKVAVLETIKHYHNIGDSLMSLVHAMGIK